MINGKLHNERYTINVVNVIFVFIRQTVYVKLKYHKVFSGNNLKNVILIYIGKIYQCNLFNKIPTQKGNVKQPELIHTGKKTYKCNLCKKFFE